MAIQAETLEVEVRATGVDSTVRDVNRVPTAVNRAAGATEQAGARAKRGASGFSAAGALVKAAAGAMVVSMGTKVITAASDLNEELSKTGVVFGPAAKSVTDNAERMAKRFGIAKVTMLEAAGGIGLVAKASGLAQPAAARLSNQLGNLAADASSFYNVPITEALDAMKSGLVGEAEPMRRFGVLLSEAAVKTEAVRLGIAKQTDELTEGQKVQARSSLIIKGMADASGDLARTQDSVSNRLREVQGRITNYAAELGTKALPYVADFLELLVESAPKIEDFAKSLWQDAQPALTTLVDAAKGAINTGKTLYEMFDRLPEPVKDLGFEIGLAALVVPKLAGVLSSVVTPLTTMAGNLRNAETRAQAFQSAISGLKMAGAIGGIALLGDASQKAGSQIATLENVAGGALLGFSIGGPIGAAVGAGAGLLRDLSSAATASWEAMKEGMKFQQGYRDSLDQTNAAITEQTRAIAFQNLQNSEALKVGRLIGLKDRDLVSAALGNEEALRRVERRVRSLTGSQKELAAAKPGELFFNKGNAQSFIASLRNMGVELDKDQRALLKQIEATKTWNQALKGLPKQVRTKIKAEDYDLTLKQVENLRDRYNLTPKQVRTIVEAMGIDNVRVKADGTIKKLKELDRQRPTPKADVKDEASPKISKIRSGAEALDRLLVNPLITARDNASNVIGNVSRGLTNLNGKIATTYVRTIYQAQGKADRMLGPIGSADGSTVPGPRHPYGDRIPYLLAPGEEVISNRFGQADKHRPLLKAINQNRLADGGTAGALTRPRPGGKDDVRESVRKGTKEGQKDAEKDRKPRKMDPEQRKTIIGLQIEIRDLRKELAKKGKEALTGLERKRAEAELAATVKELKAARRGPAPEKPVNWGWLGNLADGVKKAIDGSEVLKRFRDTIRQNTKGDRRQDLLDHPLLKRMAAGNQRLANTQERLAKAVSDLEAKRAEAEQFRGTVTEGFTRQANVLNAGRTAGDIAASLGVQVGKAQEFAAAIQALRSKGYPDGIVMQVASAGIEGGLEVAKALMAASPGEAQAITQSFNTIANIAAQAAGGVTSQMFDTGIQAAEGIVKGLEAREAKIEATLTRLAVKMAKVLRKRLKSRSPSRVTAEIGHDVGDGLIVGLNERERRITDKAARIGSVLAAGLQTGIGSTPRLPGSLSGTQGLTPASLGVGRAAGGVTFQFQTYNPVAEPESRTTNKALDRVASLSLV